MTTFKNVVRAAGATALLALSVAPAHAVTTFADTAPDGAKYGLSWTNSSQVYTFTFTADFSAVTASEALGDWIRAISIASVPGSLLWTKGTIIEAPGNDAVWSITQDTVANQSGCPTGSSSASKEWCIGASTPQAGPIDGANGANSDVFVWKWTMTLAANQTPSFTEGWSYKFVTAASGATDAGFGKYQISRKFGVCTDGTCTPGDTVPEPGTLALLGLGLLGLGLSRRKQSA
jgi:hypothetical protein